jgi:tetratricopeptide (TPR) repeat protein
MTTPDDSSPTSRPPAASSRVLSLADRRRRVPVQSPTKKVLRTLLARVDPGAGTTANESRLAPQPEWSALRKRLEQRDLDHSIAAEEGEIARGAGSLVSLRALRSLRAMRNFERGDRDAAFEEWEALFDQDPQDASPLMTRAVCFAHGKDFAAALADYDRAAVLRPNDPEIYDGRGRCFVRSGDRERAVLAYRRLIHLRPRDREALHSLATCLRFTGDLDGAIRVLGRAIKLFPWRADLYGERASCYRTKGSRAEELVDLDHAIARDPKKAATFRERAQAHAHFQDEDRQLADLTRAIELEPSHAGAFLRRAILHEKRGQLALAIADFSSALEVDPDSIALLKARAAACMKAGAFERAIADLSDVLALQRGPRTSTLWLRGHAHRKIGDAKSARRDYHEAMDFDDELFDKLVESEWKKRPVQRLKAEHFDELETLILLAPEVPEYFVLRARIFEAAGEHEKALADLDQALARAPDRSDFVEARARVLVARAKALET